MTSTTEISKLQNCVEAVIAFVCKNAHENFVWTTALENFCNYHCSWQLYFLLQIRHYACTISVADFRTSTSANVFFLCIIVYAPLHFAAFVYTIASYIYFLPYYEGLFFVRTICLHLFSCNDRLNKWIGRLINWKFKTRDTWLKMTKFSCFLSWVYTMRIIFTYFDHFFITGTFFSSI